MVVHSFGDAERTVGILAPRRNTKMKAAMDTPEEAEIDRLTAENERLRAALVEIAQMGGTEDIMAFIARDALKQTDK